MKEKIKKKLKNTKFYKAVLNILHFKKRNLENKYDFLNSNIVSGSVVVKINDIPGEYEFDIRSDILKRILISKEYEPKIAHFISSKINYNKDAINIGANIGLYANFMATRINEERKVLAIEPTNSAFNFLEKNIIRNNNQEKIITFKGIASDNVGESIINIVQGKEEYSSIGDLIHPAILEENFTTQKVKSITLDSLIKNNRLEPGLILIDVEGAEYQVLKGAIDTIKKYRPIIISEIYDELLSKQGSDSRKIIDFLEKLNYVVLDVNGKKLDFPFNGNIFATYVEP